MFRTLFFVAIAGTSFVLIDSVLANTERRETALVAAGFYEEGKRLMRQDKYAAAAEAFRSAIANARDKAEYPLALGEALLKAGDTDDAESTLTDLLKSDSMAGGPNLAMARVLVKEDQFQEAASYYHRAIYGQWKNDATVNAVSARFELAELFAGRNSKAELLSELLPLQDQAPTDAATQEKLGRLYMTAGSPVRAAAIYHDLARAYPRDTEARKGAGDAELAQGNYPAAQAAYMAAVRLRPDDQQAGAGLALANDVLNLDPMSRGLDGQERYRRSVHILQLVAEKIAQCLTPAQTQAASVLLNATQAALTRRVPGPAGSDEVEKNIDLANQLWRTERTTCASAISPADKPLQLVLAKSSGDSPTR